MIIHVMGLDKFIQPFIDFNSKYIDTNLEHKYFVIHKTTQYELKKNQKNLYEITGYFKNTLNLIISLYASKKIIIHGLWNKHLILFLFLQPWLLKKCYWVMWGGDFYFSEKQSWLKKQVIKKMGHFITYIKGDYELAKKWYGADGEYHECFMYPSNLYKDYEIEDKNHQTINIQLGNSADATNNHIEVIEKLKKYKHENINIFVPLSYSGEKEYIDNVIEKGKDIFGDKFHPMLDFMPFEEYLEFLGKIDISIFAHKRQQAMGNTITLLGLGKKVYMRSDITPWKQFNEIGVKVFDIDKITLDKIKSDTQTMNKQKIKEYFSQERYIQQLKNLFG